jgi:hypothetical protein
MQAEADADGHEDEDQPGQARGHAVEGGGDFIQFERGPALRSLRSFVAN